ncbi:hypothetical protein SPRG_09109 [Saprolegnia parasitica CBS 223.65]|uniref:CCT domain-containing protein n=1 Tax=Saprolegnia parasitica (strain CBS 223.65) TaxID=695850 RepID=A0A067C3E0_SAPPC|nr:hypothetical protein SPRG_09109 [Saprolegnia parasitica CBS 223.65]KDO25279.1 hypothetical protein SPRG_09109 [Saprolegnia parasitica CBS 223.65]|eukprot:XP_012203938.1 hypothetical protein SPRG_09109 [Saprolegnia parasitica CBS 223.65]
MDEPFEFHELDYESMALLSSTSVGGDDDDDAWLPDMRPTRRLSLEWFCPHGDPTATTPPLDEISFAFRSVQHETTPIVVTPKKTKRLKAPSAWLSPLQPNGSKTNGKMIGAYTYEARQARLARFQEKRRTRVWQKRVKYDCRQALAGARPRVKGRFVKTTLVLPDHNLLLSHEVLAPAELGD